MRGCFVAAVASELSMWRQARTLYKRQHPMGRSGRWLRAAIGIAPARWQSRLARMSSEFYNA